MRTETTKTASEDTWFSEHARCRTQRWLTVSVEERAVMESHDHRARRPLVWRLHPTAPGQAQLRTGTCPFLHDGDWCALYRQRPQACR